jgi:putative ABC transport system substrate-binding protein
MICRRTFLRSLAIGVFLAPCGSKAQQGRVFRVGLLYLGLQNPYGDLARDSLQKLGYTEGKNVVFERGFAAPEDLPSMALELVRKKVDVIWAGASPSVRAALSATKEIPIVAVDLETDPVASGYVSSLARPGGNLTGFFLDLPEFSAKRLEVLADALPSVSGVTVLWDPSLDRAPLSTIHAAARTLKLHLVVTEVQTAPDLDGAFRAAANRKGEAVMVMQSPRLDAYKDQILKLGAKYRLPVVAVFANFAAAGALLSYGPNIQDMTTRSAVYVDRVLQGAKAGDLPIQRPTKFDLIVNARTARSLGLTIEQSVLLRADDVIR